MRRFPHILKSKPIVILDDVFAQLDEARRGQILDFAMRQDQVLMSPSPRQAIFRAWMLGAFTRTRM